MKFHVCLCPKCGSDQITEDIMIWRGIDVNTNKIEYDNDIHVREYRCRNCDWHGESKDELEIDTIEKEKLEIENNIVSISKINTKEYKMAFEVENMLRDIISVKMQEICGDDWWAQKIPQKIREKAKQIYEGRHGGYSLLDDTAKPFVHYLYVEDYLKIIEEEENWLNVFHDFFNKKEIIITIITDFNQLRRKIAHNDPLSEDELTHLKSIHIRMKKYYKKIKE